MAREPMAARRAPVRTAARKDPDRPSRLRLWLKRRRGLLRPAALWLIGFGLLGATGSPAAAKTAFAAALSMARAEARTPEWV